MALSCPWLQSLIMVDTQPRTNSEFFPKKFSSHIVLTQNQLSFGHLGTLFTIWLLKRLPRVSLNKWINLTTVTCSVLRRSSMIWWVPCHSCPLMSSDSLWSYIVLSIFPRLFGLRTGTHIVIVCCVPPLQSWQWLVEMARHYKETFLYEGKLRTPVVCEQQSSMKSSQVKGSGEVLLIVSSLQFICKKE